MYSCTVHVHVIIIIAMHMHAYNMSVDTMSCMYILHILQCTSLLGGMYIKGVLQMPVEYIPCTSQLTCISYDNYLPSLIHSEPHWKATLQDVTVAQFKEFVGPSPPLPDNIRIVDLFRMFFTTALMAEIVKQTNIYARAILGEGTVFEEVKEADIWAFFGLCIMMGYHQLPAIHHYWSTDPHFYCPAISNHMTRARFVFIGASYTLLTTPVLQCHQGVLPMEHSHQALPMEHSHLVLLMERSHHDQQIACGNFAQSSKLWWLPAAPITSHTGKTVLMRRWWPSKVARQ